MQRLLRPLTYLHLANYTSVGLRPPCVFSAVSPMRGVQATNSWSAHKRKQPFFKRLDVSNTHSYCSIRMDGSYPSHHGHHQGSIRVGIEPLNQYNRQSTGTSINSWAPTDADPPTLSDSHAAPFTSWQKIVRYKMGEPRRIVNLPGFSGKPPSSLSEQCDMIRRGRRKKEGLDWAVEPVVKLWVSCLLDQ
ncbi:hypothetical protein CaCOL14_011464 [Colletotrichum acutatum]